jgi:hypothetical protein
MLEDIKNNQMGEQTSGKPSEVNLDQEAEYVPLPSQGIFYKDQFKGLDKLKVRKLNWTDEDILTTKSYYDNGTIFDEILKNTIVDENGFKATQLIPVDRDTILWWLRIGAFGRDYEVVFPCKGIDENEIKCAEKISMVWDLGNFKMPDIPAQHEEELWANGCITITLPLSGLTCKITVPSIGREREVQKSFDLKKKREKLTKDFLNTSKLISSIVCAYDKEGKEYSTQEHIYTWLNKGYNGNPIPIVDSRYILKKRQEISLEVNTKQDIICKCGHVEEGVSMPMSITFFWPDFKE